MVYQCYGRGRAIAAAANRDDSVQSEAKFQDEARLPLGVVLERRKLDNPWRDHSWRPVAVIPGAAAMDPAGDWSLMQSGEGWDHYHAGTLSLSLFRGETEGYRTNLSQEPPRLFVVLRDQDETGSEHDYVPFLVTACPYEAQDYADSGDDMVEPVVMPAAVVAFVQGFIDRHHVDEPFRKRKRKRWSADGGGVGRRSSRLAAPAIEDGDG